MKKLMKFLNPMTLINFAMSFLSRIFGFICASMGWNKPRVEGFQNFKKEDIEREAQTEREQQAALEDLTKKATTPGHVVHAYAQSDAKDRSSIDLSALTLEQQDWLLRLSDADLIMLSASGQIACERSVSALKVLPNFKKMRAQENADKSKVLTIPDPKIRSSALSDDDKFDLIREQYNALFRSLSEPALKPRTA